MTDKRSTSVTFHYYIIEMRPHSHLTTQNKDVLKGIYDFKQHQLIYRILRNSPNLLNTVYLNHFRAVKKSQGFYILYCIFLDRLKACLLASKCARIIQHKKDKA